MKRKLVIFFAVAAYFLTVMVNAQEPHRGKTCSLSKDNVTELAWQDLERIRAFQDMGRVYKKGMIEAIQAVEGSQSQAWLRLIEQKYAALGDAKYLWVHLLNAYASPAYLPNGTHYTAKDVSKILSVALKRHHGHACFVAELEPVLIKLADLTSGYRPNGFSYQDELEPLTAQFFLITSGQALGQ
ncbi:MAG TPA: hypothetical protein VEA59_02145 [Patescibacteria group bacterium]|nr:hypothetical protein [Patescibacteria group bacterium]